MPALLTDAAKNTASDLPILLTVDGQCLLAPVTLDEYRAFLDPAVVWFVMVDPVIPAHVAVDPDGVIAVTDPVVQDHILVDEATSDVSADVEALLRAFDVQTV